MPETVNLTNFVQATSTTNSTKSDNSYSPKDSFKEVLNNASSGVNSKSSSDNNVKDSSVNNENVQVNTVENDLSKKDNKINNEKIVKSTESKTSDDKVLASDDLQNSDEEQVKLKKINELLEKILSDITSGNKNLKELSAELTKLEKELNSKGGDNKTSKLSDDILEVLSSMLSSANTTTITNETSAENVINTTSSSELTSLKDTLSQLNSDLSDLVNLLASNNKSENANNLSADTKTNTELQQLNSQKTISAADLKLSQLASGNVQSDEQNLLSKIKQELSQLTASIKSGNSSELSAKTTVTNEGLSNISFYTASNKNSQLSASNDESKQNNNSNLKDDNKFLNDLAGDNKEDKFSKVTNLMNQFAQSNVSNTAINSENTVINKSTFTSDLVKSLNYMQKNDIQEMTVKIMPKELGEVLIKITSDGGIMKASITATNKDAYNLLNSNISDLNKSLQNQDIKIQNVTINIYNGDTTFFSGNNRDTDSSNDGSNKTNKLSSIEIADTEDIEDEESIYKDNSINALA